MLKLYFAGGWKARKLTDPKLLHFLCDHWLFSCFSEKFKLAFRCGIELDKHSISNGEKVSSIHSLKVTNCFEK